MVEAVTIIAGIRQFGLAPDGSDLRDLEAVLADRERQIAELRAERDEARRHCSGKDKVAKAYYDNWRDAEAENARLRALPLKDEVERVLSSAHNLIANTAFDVGESHDPRKDVARRCVELVQGWAEVVGAAKGSSIHSALYDAANLIYREFSLDTKERTDV